jgi:hypothetical protein
MFAPYKWLLMKQFGDLFVWIKEGIGD